MKLCTCISHELKNCTQPSLRALFQELRRESCQQRREEQHDAGLVKMASGARVEHEEANRGSMEWKKGQVGRGSLQSVASRDRSR